MTRAERRRLAKLLARELANGNPKAVAVKDAADRVQQAAVKLVEAIPS